MSNTFKDFDSFFSEMEKKATVQIKLYGKIYDLPSELPAITLLQTYKASKSGDTTMSEAKQLELAFDMLGEDNVTEWCEKGMTMTQLAEVMKWAAQQYMGKAEGNTGKK